MNDEKLEKLMQEVEDALVNDTAKIAAQGLAELAAVWAGAGVPMSSFIDMRKHLIERAEQRTSAVFIKEKLEMAEYQLRRDRDGEETNKTVH